MAVQRVELCNQIHGHSTLHLCRLHSSIMPCHYTNHSVFIVYICMSQFLFSRKIQQQKKITLTQPSEYLTMALKFERVSARPPLGPSESCSKNVHPYYTQNFLIRDLLSNFSHSFANLNSKEARVGLAMSNEQVFKITSTVQIS